MLFRACRGTCLTRADIARARQQFSTGKKIKHLYNFHQLIDSLHDRCRSTTGVMIQDGKNNPLNISNLLIEIPFRKSRIKIIQSDFFKILYPTELIFSLLTKYK